MMIDPKIKSMVLNAISDKSSKKMFHDDEGGGDNGENNEGKEVKKPAMKGVEIEIEAIGGKGKPNMESEYDDKMNDGSEDDPEKEEKYKEIMEKMPGITPDMIEKLMELMHGEMNAGKQVGRYDNSMDMGMVGSRNSPSSSMDSDEYNRPKKENRR